MQRYIFFIVSFILCFDSSIFFAFAIHLVSVDLFWSRILHSETVTSRTMFLFIVSWCTALRIFPIFFIFLFNSNFNIDAIAFLKFRVRIAWNMKNHYANHCYIKCKIAMNRKTKKKNSNRHKTKEIFSFAIWMENMQ